MKITHLLLSSMLLLIGLNAQPITGSTLGHYSKPGAPIDMSYLTNSVKVNETTDVNITLITSIPKGQMNVLITLDDNLSTQNDFIHDITFELSPDQREYHINLTVSSSHNNLYYIRLLTKIEKAQGSKMRAFAIPITIGEKKKRAKKNTQMMKAHGGENISVSKAIETIKVLND